MFEGRLRQAAGGEPLTKDTVLRRRGDEADISRRRLHRQYLRQSRLIPTPGRDDDVRLRSEGLERHRIQPFRPRIVPDQRHHLSLRKGLGVRVFGPVVDHHQAHSQLVGHSRQGPGDVAGPDDHQRCRAFQDLDVHLDFPSTQTQAVGLAARRQRVALQPPMARLECLACVLDDLLLEGGAANGAQDASVGPDEHPGPFMPRGGPAHPHDRRQCNAVPPLHRP